MYVDDWQTALLCFVCLELVGNLIYSLWIHRQIMHGYWEIHPCITHIFRFYFWLKTGFGHWPNWKKHIACVHRKHHKFSDERRDEKNYDPISFNLHGIKKVLFVDPKPGDAHWVSAEDIEKYAPDIANDNSWLETKVYCHKNLGKIIFSGLMTLIFGYAGLIYGILNFFFINYYEIYMSTIYVHRFGRIPKTRNSSNADLSKNSFPYGIFLFGEELHSNHHDYTANPNFARKWWEIDLTYCIAKILSYTRLLKFT